MSDLRAETRLTTSPSPARPQDKGSLPAGESQNEQRLSEIGHMLQSVRAAERRCADLHRANMLVFDDDGDPLSSGFDPRGRSDISIFNHDDPAVGRRSGQGDRQAERLADAGRQTGLLRNDLRRAECSLPDADFAATGSSFEISGKCTPNMPRNGFALAGTAQLSREEAAIRFRWSGHRADDCQLEFGQ